MILAIANQKGGVGKTTTAQALAAGLNNQGEKTLLVDLDPQCNLTYSVGIDPDSVKLSVADLLEKKAAASDAIIHAAEGDIIPGNYLLTDADIRFTKKGREQLLSDALKNVCKQYRHIIIDCPPTIGILTINALATADSVLIPLTASIYSLQGLGQLNAAIKNTQKYCNPSLTVNGLLLTRYRQANFSQQTRDAVKQIAKQLNTRLYDTVIREGIAIAESQALQGSIFKTAPKSGVASDYAAFTREFLKGETENG